MVLKPIHTLQTYINHKQESLQPPKPPPKNESINYRTMSSTMRKRHKNTSSWNIKEPFRLHLQEIENVNCDLNRTMKIGIHLGLYHGERKLCALRKSTDVIITSNRTIAFDEDISFDILLQNLPRMARLCMVVYEIVKSVKVSGSRSKKSSLSNSKDATNTSNTNSKEGGGSNVNAKVTVNNKNPLAWVNTTIFDYKHQLKHGVLTLYTWTYADDIQSDEIFHPLGTIEPNPRKDECAIIKITFHK